MIIACGTHIFILYHHVMAISTPTHRMTHTHLKGLFVFLVALLLLSQKISQKKKSVSPAISSSFSMQRWKRSRYSQCKHPEHRTIYPTYDHDMWNTRIHLVSSCNSQQYFDAPDATHTPEGIVCLSCSFASVSKEIVSLVVFFFFLNAEVETISIFQMQAPGTRKHAEQYTTNRMALARPASKLFRPANS